MVQPAGTLRASARSTRKPRKALPNRNKAVLVGFRNAYVFDTQIEGAELPAMREVGCDVGD
jgi:hypothetical protein